MYGIIQGLDHAITSNADIINISVVSQEKTGLRPNTPIEMVMKIAEAKGILIVSAAGNDGKDIDLSENTRYPACAPNPNQIVIGAADCTNENFASFASVGKKRVHFFAPGESVGVYARGSGPSRGFSNRLLLCSADSGRGRCSTAHAYEFGQLGCAKMRYF
ncbi:MAG: S8 family serine peptidase [Haliscomenobacter sp.]|nr:S8 family serine peptidase [Haliscomenobacter sp.]